MEEEQNTPPNYKCLGFFAANTGDSTNPPNYRSLSFVPTFIPDFTLGPNLGPPTSKNTKSIPHGTPSGYELARGLHVAFREHPEVRLKPVIPHGHGTFDMMELFERWASDGLIHPVSGEKVSFCEVSSLIIFEADWKLSGLQKGDDNSEKSIEKSGRAEDGKYSEIDIEQDTQVQWMSCTLDVWERV